MATEIVLAKYIMICSSIAVLYSIVVSTVVVAVFCGNVVFEVVLLTVFCNIVVFAKEKQVRPNRVKSSEGGKRERDVALSEKDHHHDHDYHLLIIS